MRNNAKWLVCQILVTMMVTGQYVQAQVSTPMPQIIQKGKHYTLEVDGKPFFMLGGQCGNSSNWPNMLPGVWDTMKTVHANTLEIPIYWEEVEPAQGNYDFSSVQRLLDQARENNMRLMLLWFATWKNGSNHYMPE
ncbi:MAG: beta-galactosidase [Bacteroides sp.]|nr:beta-galactosidase [Bacteroides sp.]